jgi:hypothetical protein
VEEVIKPGDDAEAVGARLLQVERVAQRLLGAMNE